jgi:hypothetical protein
VPPAGRLEGLERRNGRGAECGEQTEGDRRHRAHRGRKRERAAVQAHVQVGWRVARGEQGHDGRRRDPGKHGTDGRGGNGNRAGFDQHLLNETRTARANREAQRHLTRAGGGPREHQVRQVGTGEQQHQADDSGQDPERTLEVPPQLGDAVRRRTQGEPCAQELRAPLGRRL